MPKLPYGQSDCQASFFNSPAREPLIDDYADADFKGANSKAYGRRIEPHEVTIFDRAASDEAADAAIQQADENANPVWADVFYATLYEVAKRLPIFSADDVWQNLPPDIGTHEGRAAGGVIRRAVQDQVISFNGTFTRSRRAHCHSMPIREYQSLVYQGA